jgi:uncharacterized protein (TIGR02246 family)
MKFAAELEHEGILMTIIDPPIALPRAVSVSVSAEDAAAVREIVTTLAKSWAQNDADTLAGLYAEDATVALPGDTYLKGRPEIRAWMAAAFEGKWKGTHVLGIPLEIRYVNDIILMFSHGGAYQPGASEVSVDDSIRGIWVFTRQGSGLTIAAYENTPVRATIPIPDAARMPV